VKLAAIGEGGGVGLLVAGRCVVLAALWIVIALEPARRDGHDGAAR
jgi:hypothetical protein